MSVDRTLLREAVQSVFQDIERCKQTEPVDEMQEEVFNQQEASLLQCLERDPDHESVAERVVAEYERRKGQSDG